MQLFDLHMDFSAGWKGGLVFSSLEEFSTVCCDPHSQRLGVVDKAEVDVFLELSCHLSAFIWISLVPQLVKNLPAIQETLV